MFFFAALFVASFIISLFLMPKAKIENARASSINDFNFPRAKEGDPVPRGYGTWKTKGANTITLIDFEARAITKKVKTGLFSSKKVITGYQYFIGLDAMVALGPCVEFRRMWLGKNEVWNGCRPGCFDEAFVANINLPNLYGGSDDGGRGGVKGAVAFYSGSFDQDADPYLISKLETGDDLVPAYVGMAHAVFRKFWWGNTPSVDPIFFELRCLVNSLGVGGSKHFMANGLDANPVVVLYDIYCNDWGNLNIDPALIDTADWIAAAEIVYDENNGFSGEVSSPQHGADITKEILRQINATIFQDPESGLFKLKLIRADYVEADLPILGPAQVAEVQNFSKSLWEETSNLCRVKYQDRFQDYKDDVPAVAQDFANIRFQKRVKPYEISMPFVKVAANANTIAARELSNVNVPLYQAELIINREAATLGPGEVFKWNAPEYNIEYVIVRVRKFGLGTREDGKIHVFVVQDQFASQAVVYADPAPAILDAADYAPHDITTYVIAELPAFLFLAIGETPTNSITRYASFVKKPGNSIDFFALKEDTDGDFEIITNGQYAPNAKIIGAIGEYDGFATGEITTITIGTVSNPDYLEAHTSAELRLGNNLFLLGDEFFAFETLVDNGDETYTLGVVKRALLDTTIEAHADGDTLYFVDGQEAFFDEDFAVPSTENVYLLDRTIQGRSTKAGATINAIAPTTPPRAWRPAPPDYLTVDAARVTTTTVGTAQVVALAWHERNRLDTSIPFEDDATEAAEAATTYDVGVYQGSTELFLDPGVSGASYSLTIPSGASGAAEIRVWAVRDTFRSLTPAIYPITIVEGLVIDGDAVLIDGATISF